MAELADEEAGGEEADEDDEEDDEEDDAPRRRRRRGREKPTLVLTEAWEEPDFPFLKGEDREASVSVGTITDGRLVNGRLLPLPSLTYRLLPSTAKRGYLYGTDELIALIEDAAATFHADQKEQLVVGNVGRRGGGDIRQSVSHNNGRDFDLGFCYRTARGKRYRARKLVPLDRKGKSSWGGGQTLDAACTWSIIKALLTSDVAEVQYIFISEPLKRLLIEHAREAREPGDLILEARARLLEPPRSAPHDDHLHVRIFCSVTDLTQGCVDDGPRHPDAERRQEQANARFDSIAATLLPQEPTSPEPAEGDGASDGAVIDEAGDVDEAAATEEADESGAVSAPEERVKAIERLVLAKRRTDAIAAALEDEAPEVRRAAAVALGKLRDRDYAERLEERFKADPDGAVRAALLRAMGELGGFEVAHLVRDLLKDPSTESIQAGPLPQMIITCYTSPPGVEKPRRRAMAPPDAPHFCGQVLDLSKRSLTLRLAAVEVAADMERPEPVEALMALLDHKDPLMRGRAARALRRLTNHTEHVPWARPELPSGRRKRGLQGWADWWERRKDDHRKTWLSAGFRARGLNVPQLERRALWALVEAINYEDYLSYNAQRSIARLTEHDPGSLTWPKHVATRYWTRYVDERRGTYRLRRCPMALDDYCPLD